MRAGILGAVLLSATVACAVPPVDSRGADEAVIAAVQASMDSLLAAASAADVEGVVALCNSSRGFALPAQGSR